MALALQLKSVSSLHSTQVNRPVGVMVAPLFPSQKARVRFTYRPLAFWKITKPLKDREKKLVLAGAIIVHSAKLAFALALHCT